MMQVASELYEGNSISLHHISYVDCIMDKRIFGTQEMNDENYSSL